MEAVNILAISSSPRRAGNSEKLLDQVVAGARSIGANVDKVALNDYKISPCLECGGCAGTGKCVIDDDYQDFYTHFFSADRVIIASPIFFMTVSAQAKALIDRGQALWVRKYVLKERIPAREGFPRKGYLVATGGSGMPNAFDCARTVCKYFYKTIDMDFAGDICVNNVNKKDDIDRHPDGLRAAYELGMQAANPL